MTEEEKKIVSYLQERYTEACDDLDYAYIVEYGEDRVERYRVKKSVIGVILMDIKDMLNERG